ncbi:hypothetical protein F5J12DRAFT_781625 [Pisolithus orientalis]|uniref:uncharacterized protein n=1 Tax=Pisolithus orientalis TaxID=936130 RepID=UPI0022250054|nr:uncharacterized protein F5J12DRAFT_781625 [Pisolithus orientalis]KAI6012758.1 hypothetical protein F5J12DRAFT_781625 [Pisolithus orientalis]
MYALKGGMASAITNHCTPSDLDIYMPLCQMCYLSMKLECKVHYILKCLGVINVMWLLGGYICSIYPAFLDGYSFVFNNNIGGKDGRWAAFRAWVAMPTWRERGETSDSTAMKKLDWYKY